jgi:hypothetical protein
MTIRVFARNGMSMSKVKLHGLQSRTAFLNSMSYQNSDASMIRFLFYSDKVPSAGLIRCNQSQNLRMI